MYFGLANWVSTPYHHQISSTNRLRTVRLTGLKHTLKPSCPHPDRLPSFKMAPVQLIMITTSLRHQHHVLLLVRTSRMTWHYVLCETTHFMCIVSSCCTKNAQHDEKELLASIFDMRRTRHEHQSSRPSRRHRSPRSRPEARLISSLSLHHLQTYKENPYRVSGYHFILYSKRERKPLRHTSCAKLQSTTQRHMSCHQHQKYTTTPRRQL